MVDRIPLSKRLRFEVFKRDEFRCVYCGATPSETVILECDHVVPVSAGGLNEIENLVTACYACNRGKGAVPLSFVPAAVNTQSIEEKAAETAEHEAQLRAYYEIAEAKKSRRDEELWSIADVYMSRFGDDSIQRTRLASIRIFLDRLDYFEVLEAMEIATNRMHSRAPAFRYFAGICWKKIKRANGEDV